MTTIGTTDSHGDFNVAPDSRMEQFIGGFDPDGRPIPITPGGLRRRTDEWPIAASTPTGVAGLLQTSRDLFVQAYFHYEFLVVAAQWSLYAVEAALRVTDGGRTSLKSLINRAYNDGRIGENDRRQMQAARDLRNAMTHSVAQETWTIGMSSGVLRASHELVASVFAASAETRVGGAEGAGGSDDA